MTTPSRPILLALLLVAPFAVVGADAIPDPLAGYPEGSVLMPDGDVAVPLRQDTPPWYTPEMHKKVLLAGEKGMGYDPVADQEVMLATNWLFIRPGTMMWSPSICTMNFIYGTYPNYKIGSAGHCNPQGSDVVLLLANPGILVNIGKTSVSHNNGVGDDYSLVDIKSSFQNSVDANVADIWGPQGPAFNSEAYVGLIGKHVGHGTGIGTGGTPRAGQVMFVRGTAYGCVCVVDWGDSGSPILAVTQAHPLGQPLGVITHLSVGTSTNYGTLVTAIPATVKSGDINPLPPA